MDMIRKARGAAGGGRGARIPRGAKYYLRPLCSGAAPRRCAFLAERRRDGARATDAAPLKEKRGAGARFRASVWTPKRRNRGVYRGPKRGTIY